jgi:formylglycine-generating enzyme required for sulfatase activity
VIDAALQADLIDLAGGAFVMGTDEADGYPEDGEGPARVVSVPPFRIDRCTVSNARFAEFVADSGYVTVAERTGVSFVFSGLLPQDFPETRAVASAPWWRSVAGACWRHPEGPGSTLSGRERHPVVHVSWWDAEAFCAWAGLRLPSETEWEYAARGGLVRARFPWGDEISPAGEPRANVWQGEFPVHNTLEDGYLATAPVDAFPPNGYGLRHAVGNVWQWCADWFSEADGRRAMRGGSYLCHESYCFRFRVAARSGNTPDSSAGNVGFRCASS